MIFKEPEETLPEAGALETAKSYREKKVKPFIEHFLGVFRSLYRSYVELITKYNQLVSDYNGLSNQYDSLVKINEYLAGKNEKLEKFKENFSYVQRAFGKSQVEKAIKSEREKDNEYMIKIEEQQERVMRR